MPILPELRDDDAAWKALQAAEDAAALSKLQQLARKAFHGIDRYAPSALPEDLENYGGFKKAVLAIVSAYPGTLDPQESLFVLDCKLQAHALKLRKTALPTDKEKVGPMALTTLESVLRIAAGVRGPGQPSTNSPEERLAGIASDVRYFLTEVADRA